MVFSSIAFLCAFLPGVWLLYQAPLGMRYKNAVLLVASVLFYAYGEPAYVVLLLLSALANWLLGLGVAPGRPHRGLTLALAVVLNLGLLAVFKYADLFVATLNALAGTRIPLPSLPLPIGISFYTFQALSYVIDVWRGDAPANRNPWQVTLYICLFPQLVAGPIVKYREVAEQIEGRDANPALAARGLRRFALGLAKKVLIANRVALVADALFGVAPNQLFFGSAWLAAAAYLLQIYLDFSAYSDMAIGLGALFGFTFAENFEHPYVAASVQGFWRRWHISLSTWFRDYLYIPLGGNRRGRARRAQPARGVLPLRALARGELDLRPLGPLSRRVAPA